MRLWWNLTRASAQRCDEKQKHVLTSLRAETNSANIYSCGRVEKCTFKYFNTLTGFCRKMRIITLNSHFFSHLLLPDLHFPACTLTTWENLSGGIWLLTIIGIHPEKSSSYFKVQKDMFHFLLNKDKRQIWDEILSRRREAARQSRDLASAPCYYTSILSAAALCGFLISSNAVCSFEVGDP